MCAVFRFSGSMPATFAAVAVVLSTLLGFAISAGATTLKVQILTGKIPGADILAEIELRQALQMGRIPPVLNAVLEKDYLLRAEPESINGSFKLPDGSQLFFSCQAALSEAGRGATLSKLVFARKTGKESQFPANDETVTPEEPLVKDQVVPSGNTTAFYFLLVSLVRD
jgi:hypothetical protein